ncbi:acyltransferase family protein [Paracoccus limosus]|uniref:Acyltransferase family protein n=1 Tax=Paracoccus limosus TaxID=913252 RepID=A0A844H6A8_9RHOB|nr:acyltransferase family protein [Paracoccus limosus]MTH34970.1 acyltransferase family protein [Paracoccus limosus]
MKRIHSLDYLKTVFAVLVVFAHTNWMQANMSPRVFVVGNGLLRMLVPLFCVIAGYFLFHAVQRGKTRKWLLRVLMLYVFWMALYYPHWRGQVTGLRSLGTTLFWGYLHLWFLSGLLLAGLALTGLLALGRRLAPGWEIWFVILPATLCALVGVTLEYLDLSGLASVSAQRYRNGLFLCFPFLVIGFMLSRQMAGGNPIAGRRRLLAVAALGLGLLCLEAWLVQSWRGTGVMIEIPVMTYLAVPAVFLLVLGVDAPPQAVDLGLISASIYFLHIWAFELGYLLGFDTRWELLLIGVSVPTLIALLYGALVPRSRRLMRRGGAARRAEAAQPPVEPAS